MDDRAALLALLRTDFPSFLRKTFGELSPGDEFKWGWYLDAIAWQLERVAVGETTRLIVTIPPRHLKSITISIAWVAWWLGRHPEMRFICLSYNNELAAKLSRDCRQVMTSAWYRELFPDTILKRSTEMELETTQNGGRFASSVGGTLTGIGADCIIIDDPMKADDAMSAAMRHSVTEWTTTTLFSRLNDKQTGSIILVMQRLHEDDLAGHLLDRGGWDHLNLPIIALDDEEVPVGPNRHRRRAAGELLHPEREPLEVVRRLERELGTLHFSAQYQQAPVPMGGTMIERSWLKYYAQRPEKTGRDKIVQSWDTATKDGALNDYSVCVTALVRDPDVIILDVFRARLKFPELLRQVQMQAERWRPDIVLVEDAASGQQLIQALHSAPPPGMPRPIACKAERDKVTRMSAQSSKIESGSLILPQEAPWLAAFLLELLAFPNGRHDDQVDALSQLLEWASRAKWLPCIAPPLLLTSAADMWPR